MGLFSRFSRSKGNGKQDLSEYSGMRFEVMDEDGRLQFIARAGVSWGGDMELQPLTTPNLPRNTTEFPALLRGYEVAVKKAVHIEATLTTYGNGVWHVEDSEVTSKDNDRAFFRQETTIGGEVLPMKRLGVISQPCRLVNISAGGVCIRTSSEFMKGEKLLLKSNLLEGWELTPLVCVVRRVTRRRLGYEYGCEFIDLNPATEDLIAKAIMEMQIQRKRYE